MIRPFRPQGGGPQSVAERDWLAPDNALELARRIAAFWQSRVPSGHAPVLAYVERGGVPEKNVYFAVVRSNLVNGLPSMAKPG